MGTPGKRARTDGMTRRSGPAVGGSRPSGPESSSSPVAPETQEPVGAWEANDSLRAAFGMEQGGGTPDADAGDASQPLDEGVRGRMEPLFGEDFSGVRMHEDSELATAQGAHALAEGQDVHFAPGQFAPGTAEGDFLIGHELAHVVQQREGQPTAQAKLSAAGPVQDATLEREADRAGSQVANGEKVDPLQGRATAGAPQFFSGEEHKRMGDAATGNEVVEDLSQERDGFSLSFGDIVLLAGDMFANPEDIRKLARTKEGQKEIQWAIWESRDDKTNRPEPVVDQEVKDRVLERYYKLAAKNVSHFSAGGTAEETYLGRHKQALVLAYKSELDGDYGLMQQAIAEEAFAQHHLSDMFSGGTFVRPAPSCSRKMSGRRRTRTEDRPTESCSTSPPIYTFSSMRLGISPPVRASCTAASS